MKRWRWTLLVFELALFALILILPQVDLPDFTFHSGTAPVVMKSRLSSGSHRLLAVVPVPTTFVKQGIIAHAEFAVEQGFTNVHGRLSLICTLLC